MKIARQAERSVIITFIFAGSKRPGEKREREREREEGEKSEETYNETTLATYIYIYIYVYYSWSLWNPITASASYAQLLVPAANAGGVTWSLPVLRRVHPAPPFRREIETWIDRGGRREEKGKKLGK